MQEYVIVMYKNNNNISCYLMYVVGNVKYCFMFLVDLNK